MGLAWPRGKGRRLPLIWGLRGTQGLIKHHSRGRNFCQGCSGVSMLHVETRSVSFPRHLLSKNSRQITPP